MARRLAVSQGAVAYRPKIGQRRWVGSPRRLAIGCRRDDSAQLRRQQQHQHAERT